MNEAGEHFLEFNRRNIFSEPQPGSGDGTHSRQTEVIARMGGAHIPAQNGVGMQFTSFQFNKVEYFAMESVTFHTYCTILLKSTNSNNAKRKSKYP